MPTQAQNEKVKAFENLVSVCNLRRQSLPRSDSKSEANKQLWLEEFTIWNNWQGEAITLEEFFVNNYMDDWANAVRNLRTEVISPIIQQSIRMNRQTSNFPKVLYPSPKVPHGLKRIIAGEYSNPSMNPYLV